MRKKTSHLYHVTDADRALFRTAIATIRPQPASTQAPVRQTVPETITLEDYWLTTVTAEERLYFRRSGIQHRQMDKLQRGRLPVQAVLDLHGQTVVQARGLLQQFLHIALQRHYRCIRIVHGKSRLRAHPPMLKNYLNSWLQQYPAVLAFCSALPKDGGTGAVYVLLKSL